MANKKPIIEEEPADHGTIHFAWTFKEFGEPEKLKQWYFRAGLVVLLLLAVAVFNANLLFAIIIIVSSVIVVLFHRDQNQVDFEINEDGIKINKKFYPYETLKDFYIIYSPPEVKTLYFEPLSYIEPRIPIKLEDQDPVAVREVLLQYLTEDIEKEDEPVSNQVSKILKL